jgi:hypothetical protein
MLPEEAVPRGDDLLNSDSQILPCGSNVVGGRLLLFLDVWQEVPTSDFIRDIVSVGLRLSFIPVNLENSVSLSSYFLYLKC